MTASRSWKGELRPASVRPSGRRPRKVMDLMSTSSRLLPRVVIVLGLLVWFSGVPAEVAEAVVQTCGTSNGHTICVTLPSSTLTGAVPVTVTNNPNSGTVIATWIPSGKSAIALITDYAPSPATNDYTFVWPTQKYLDAAGTLRVQYKSTSNTPVDVPVTLSNGNTTDFQHSPNDWASFLPGAWSASRDPVVAAVGDGADDTPLGNSVARSLARSRPDLFLYLGDIYERGTFTENLNHYGKNAMDRGPGTLWGRLARITQPTIGNHEKNEYVWQDYFHQRPLYTSFRFGHVLFFDLASSGSSMGSGSAQYNYVKGILTSPSDPPPPCIVAFWHIPALSRETGDEIVPMWKLLADHGGDLVLNGHIHTMAEFKPLNRGLHLPSTGEPTMVELINGAGGHHLDRALVGDRRLDWSVGEIPGVLDLRLRGAGSGGTATALSWAFKRTNGRVLHTGSRTC